MDNLKSSILATVAYYDIIDFPLKSEEVYKYLINPGRISILNKPIDDFEQDDVAKQLENLVKLNFVGSWEGYYFLKGRERICLKRLERAGIAQAKWKKFLNVSRWLQSVPYVRGIFASGSMAMNNTSEDSDFDVLIIAKPGRIYTARLLLLVLTSLMRTRRRWFDLKAPNKLCFNHHITEDNLHIGHHSLYNAQSYAHLKPVLVSKELFEKFFTANNWINRYLYNFRASYDYSNRRVSTRSDLVLVAKILEFVLNTKLGDWLEEWAKRYQQNRINKNPKTHDSGGRVIVNDKELEFHPNSFEKYLINKYNQTIKDLGILAPFPEQDSGLTI